MEEIDLKDLFNHFKKNFIKIAITAILISGVLIGYTLITHKDMYQSTTTLLIPTQDAAQTLVIVDGEAIAAPSDVMFSRSTMSNYIEIAKSRSVLNNVIENIDFDLEKKDLEDMMSIKLINGSNILEITVKSENKEEPQLIAQTLADSFKEKIKEIYEIENIKTIDQPEETTEPVESNLLLKSGVIVLGSFLVISFTTFFVYMFKSE